jgi:hypothetical protein
MPDEAQSNLVRLIDQQAFLSAFNDFDVHMQESRKRLPSRNAGTQSGDIAWLLFDFARDHFFMLRVIGLKLSGIGKAFQSAREQENPIAHLTLARAFVEHTASLSFQVDALGRAYDDLMAQGDPAKIREIIAKHREIINRLYYGGSPKGDGVKGFHVNDMIDVLSKDYEKVEYIYNELCEFVHPNHGSNALVSSGKLGEGMLSLPMNFYDSEITFACIAVEECADLYFHYQISASKHLISLDSRIQIASQPNAKASQIFSEKSSHDGDGKTKDTAIFFKKARTHFEAMESVYSYLAKNGISVRMRQIVGIEDGYMFETYETTQDRLWFKFRVT